ncbi:MAG: helix-turn-helix transcriptional regulator [Pseudomonadota bacterium]
MPAWRQPNPVHADAYRRLRQVLVEARQQAGLCQRQLAARIGKPASHVCMIETGQRRIDVLEFARIARSLGADPLALFKAATNPISLRAQGPWVGFTRERPPLLRARPVRCVSLVSPQTPRIFNTCSADPSPSQPALAPRRSCSRPRPPPTLTW